MSSSDLYETLQIPKTASNAEIKKAYKKMAIKHHPDKGGNEEDFKKISEAYSILSDEKKRKQYDTFGTYDETNMQMPDMSDLFANIFGSAGGGHPFSNMFFGGNMKAGGGNVVKKTPEKQITLQCTLEEVFNGATISYRLNRKIWKKGQKCSHCNGKGNQVKMMQIGPGMISQNVIQCAPCKGMGESFDERFASIETEIVKIPIPKGIPNGNRLALRNQGDKCGDWATGDVIVVVQHKPHSIYKIYNKVPLHLEREIKISFGDFMNGFLKEMKHLDGRIYTLIHRGPMMRFLDKAPYKIIEKMGFHYRNNIGDLILKFNVDLEDESVSSNDSIEKSLKNKNTQTIIDLQKSSFFEC